MRGGHHDEMSRFFLSRALAEVGFISVIISLFSVIFDVVGLLTRPAHMPIENAQVASLIVNIKYLAIGLGTYLIFFVRYRYLLHHANKEDD
jgi:formate-dependent nitrite reductase membrane component NrfD